MCNSTGTKFIDGEAGKKLREKTVVDFLFSNIDIRLIYNKFKFFAFARNFIDKLEVRLKWKGEKGSLTKMFLFVFNHKLDFIRDSIISDKLGLGGDEASCHASFSDLDI